MKTRTGRYSDNRKGRSHAASVGVKYFLQAFLLFFEGVNKHLDRCSVVNTLSLDFKKSF